MFDFRSLKEWRQIWRYYQAGAVNTLFGFGIYSIFVFNGINAYLSQILSHILGMAFNYITYSRYAFRSEARIGAFVGTYILNYVLSLATLAMAMQFFRSLYVSGLITIIIVSLINYFVLKKLVYNRLPS